MGRGRRLGAFTAGLLGLGLVALVSSPRNPVGYLARVGAGQAEMLLGRVDVEAAIAAGHFSETQVARARLVPRVKDWGRERVGLAASDNYDTIHPTWDRQIWNVSACEPLSFEARRYWFPIVGSLTYIGFFEEDEARAHEARLEVDSLDTYVRTAGAYSTLGWFRDPLLPHMLDWDEDRLADTLLHELAHATLWVPGHPGFNEAFANFVGERAALGWIEHHHGPDSAEVKAARHRDEDQLRYRELLRGVVAELEAIYAHPALPRDEKLARKAAILASLPSRAEGAGFWDRERYRKLFQDPGRWNNARLLQFRTYHRGQESFAALLAAHEGDLRAFIEALRDVVDGADDPWEALAEASGVDAGS